MSGPVFSLRVWGARGSVSAPATDNCRFGSDTSCIEVRAGGRVVLLDAGTGIIPCGRRLKGEGVETFDVLLTHCHFDHVMGLPFMPLLYADGVSARIHAGHFLDNTTCRNMVERFMCAPYFPITPKQFAAGVDYVDFRPPDRLRLAEGLEVATLRLNHPNGAVGYRLDCGGRAIAYVTDTEHEPGRPSEAILAFVEGCDVMIYDSMYTDAEFPAYRGYGHSTWEEGVRLCRAARVGALVIHHHDISRDDVWLEDLSQRARDVFPEAHVGRTGLVIEVAQDGSIATRVDP
ncbi:MBL fold metallo-hydrolase [Aurantimonas sp. Leaf443]|uniref:MBL fold metallo-hydrolase n=1 Tax=Aurantimonas sp. Leaf443 TaxID=1736378 RepID=UPI0009E6B057|nr:MBL fold metallo-hydrolase [Aurantimonas sp. Leaf443]